MNQPDWEARFKWLLQSATDGFGTPNGWTFGWESEPEEAISKLIEDIDKWIELDQRSK